MTIHQRIINSKALLILKGDDQFYFKAQMSMSATTKVSDLTTKKKFIILSQLSEFRPRYDNHIELKE